MGPKQWCNIYIFTCMIFMIYNYHRTTPIDPKTGRSPNQATVPTNALVKTSAVNPLRSEGPDPTASVASFDPPPPPRPGNVVKPNWGTYLNSKKVSWPRPIVLFSTVIL